MSITKRGLAAGLTTALAGCAAMPKAQAAIDDDGPPTLAELARRVQRTEDQHRIQNLMSRLVYLNEAGLVEDILSLFAQQTPGVTVQIGRRGVFEGLEGARRTMIETARIMNSANGAGVRRAFPNLAISDDRTGMQEILALSSPLVEVSGDGRTAKGMWTAPGAQTQFSTEANGPGAFWVWIKFAVDFVREGRDWRIWHYNLLPLFRTSYDRSWVEASATPLRTPPGMPRPDRPTNEFFQSYDARSAPRLVPRPPEPYETFSETFSY